MKKFFMLVLSIIIVAFTKAPNKFSGNKLSDTDLKKIFISEVGDTDLSTVQIFYKKYLDVNNDGNSDILFGVKRKEIEKPFEGYEYHVHYDYFIVCDFKNNKTLLIKKTTFPSDTEKTWEKIDSIKIMDLIKKPRNIPEIIIYFSSKVDYEIFDHLNIFYYDKNLLKFVKVLELSDISMGYPEGGGGEFFVHNKFIPVSNGNYSIISKYYSKEENMLGYLKTYKYIWDGRRYQKELLENESGYVYDRNCTFVKLDSPE